MFSGRSIAAALTLFVVSAIGLAGCGGAPARPGTGRIKIAFLLPDLRATRYDRFDVPYFAAKVDALCHRCDIIYRNAAELPGTQRFQADEAIAAGADVLVIDAVDTVAARGIAETAKRKGIPVIAYDRLIDRADLDYYVAFDNENIGRIQAAALVQKLQRTGLQGGRIVMINGSDTDYNALLNNKGARSVFDRTQFELGPDQDHFVPESSPAEAQKFMANELHTLQSATGATTAGYGMGLVAVYAATDDMAAGAIDAFKAAGVTDLPPITGQDAELDAIQRILVGEQYMTVHKSYREQAERAAEYAVALARGQRPQAPSMVNNGFKDVPTALAGVTAITRDNLQSTVIDTHLYTIAEVCAGRFLAPCAAARLH